MLSVSYLVSALTFPQSTGKSNEISSSKSRGSEGNMLIQNKQVSSLSSKNPRWPQDLQVKHILDHVRREVSETVRLPGRSVTAEDELHGWRGNHELVEFTGWMCGWNLHQLTVSVINVQNKCAFFFGKDTYWLYFVAGFWKCEEGKIIKKSFLSIQSYGLMSVLKYWPACRSILHNEAHNMRG